ncbi:MAG: M24 family metallopeptidase, partial [Oscillospiraceae bacterium]
MLKNYIEDTSIQGRRAEIAIKCRRIRTMLDENGYEALLLTKHPNFSWITAGGKSFVANCFDNGAVSVLITKDSCYAICNIIEEPRLINEEKMPELGFELFVYGWEENLLEEFVCKHVSCIDKVVSDTPCGGATVDLSLIDPLRYCLTENEIARYRHLGDTMSMLLEEYMPKVRPGMTEYEIAGGISKALWKCGIEQVMHLVSADERSFKYRHGLPTEKILKHNLIVSINGRYKGLVTTISRMVYFGIPDKSLTEQYLDCCEMECMTTAKARVGTDEIEM